MIAFTALITASVDKPGVYSGAFPAEPAREWKRAVAEFRRIGMLRERVRKLERDGGMAGKDDEENDT